jgi:hypothetical protein
MKPRLSSSPTKLESTPGFFEKVRFSRDPKETGTRTEWGVADSDLFLGECGVGETHKKRQGD